jgi:thiamine monophosphate kinase
VPISPRVLAAAPYLEADPLKLALMGGEDYLLLFTAGREMVPRLAPAFHRAGLHPPLLLGEIVAGDRVSLVTGASEVDISGAGFDHFRLDLKPDSI